MPGHPALEVRFPPRRHDLLSGALWEAGSTGLEDLAPGHVRAYFVTPPGQAVLDRLRRQGASSIRGLLVPDEDWVAMGRRAVRAVRIGRLLVRPPWSRARPEPGGVEVVIDPARAFGTANHESTRLVLRLLLRQPLRGRGVLDFGAGSGILALAAIRLGARRAVAVDIDPEAVEATRDNARRNGLLAGLRVRLGGADGLRGRFDVVLANLTGPLHVEAGGRLAARIAAGGVLLAGGLLTREEEEVSEAYRRAGLAPTARRQENEWVGLCLGAA